jgi:2-methylaconitate isomerase
MSGMAKNVEQAKFEMPSVPKIAIVTEPHVAKMISMGKFHRTFAGSGIYNLAAATLLLEQFLTNFL